MFIVYPMTPFQRFKTFFCALTVLTLLSACQTTADLAMQAFERRDYVDSVTQYAQYATQRGNTMMEKKRLEFQTVVNHSATHYEDLLAQTAATDYANRIIQLRALKTIRASLYSPIHQQLVPEVMQRLSLDTLSTRLADEYYQLGQSITGQQREDHQRRAEAYQQALQQVNPYKDSQALFTRNDKTYKGLLAEDLYQEGLAFAKGKDHKAAASRFGQIASIYAPYGDYKNTAALLKQHETLWRTAEYTTLVQQADAAALLINTKRSARTVAAQYQKAVATLSTYGDSKAAQQKASQYQQQGMIRVFIDDDGKPLMRSSSTSTADAALSQAPLKAHMRLTKNRKEADIVVTIRLKEHYERDGDSVDRSPQTLHVRDGNKTTTHADGSSTSEPNYRTQRFTKITVSAENRYTLTMTTTVTGLSQTKHSDEVTVTSTKKVMHYEGDVPSGTAYDQQEVSTMNSKDDLAKEARKKADSALYTRLYQTAARFDAL